MLKRILASAALAALITLGGASAASAAYPAPADSLSCDSTTVAPNETFNCSIEGPNGADATLVVTTTIEDATIAGTTSLTKIIASNVAVFTVTMPANPGQVTLSALIDGVPVDTAVVTVAAVSGAAGSDGLATTGSDNLGMGLVAVTMLIAGAGALAIAARRKSAQYSSPEAARARAGAGV